MSLNKTAKKMDFKPIPEDTHIAALYSIVDIGDHDSGFTKEDGTPTILTKVVLTFEFQDLPMDDGRPMALSNTYTVSINERAKLRPVLQATLGKDAKKLDEDGVNIGELLKESLGKHLMITIKHHTKEGKTYANIEGVAPVHSALKKSLKEVHNPLVFIDDYDNATEKDLQLVPDWLKKRAALRLNAQNKPDSDCPY